jgi:5'-nucleotidase
MRKLIFFYLSIALFVSLGCAPTSRNNGHIYILSTNDIHATIDAFPRLATIVDEYAELGEVLLVDSGDRVSGNAYVDDAAEPGVPLIELMNDMGYDVVTLGNHEFDKGADTLRMMLDAAHFDVVCANVRGKSGAPQPIPYTIINVRGVDIGFAGVVDTDNGGLPLGSRHVYADFEFRSDIDAAYEVCDSLSAKSDFVVLLSHMGLRSDRQLAERGVACNWIAGGHSHDVANEDVCGVRITQNNKNIRYVTVADLEVVDGAIVEVTYTQISMGDVAANEAVVERVEALKASDPELNRVEGRVTSLATKEGVVNFTISALAEYPYDDGFSPEVTFYHYGGVRLDSLRKGDVIRAEILNNDPFKSTIYIGTLTTQQMRDFILAKYNSGTPENPDKESHYPYFRSDAHYRIVVGDGNEEYPDAEDVIFDIPEGEYRVAMCNYIADNYIDPSIVGRQLQPTGISVRSAMFRYLRSFGDEGYTPSNECRQQEVKR